MVAVRAQAALAFATILAWAAGTPRRCEGQVEKRPDLFRLSVTHDATQKGTETDQAAKQNQMMQMLVQGLQLGAKGLEAGGKASFAEVDGTERTAVDHSNIVRKDDPHYARTLQELNRNARTGRNDAIYDNPRERVNRTGGVTGKLREDFAKGLGLAAESPMGESTGGQAGAPIGDHALGALPGAEGLTRTVGPRASVSGGAASTPGGSSAPKKSYAASPYPLEAVRDPKAAVAVMAYDATGKSPRLEPAWREQAADGVARANALGVEAKVLPVTDKRQFFRDLKAIHQETGKPVDVTYAGHQGPLAGYAGGRKVFDLTRDMAACKKAGVSGITGTGCEFLKEDPTRFLKAQKSAQAQGYRLETRGHDEESTPYNDRDPKHRWYGCEFGKGCGKGGNYHGIEPAHAPAAQALGPAAETPGAAAEAPGPAAEARPALTESSPSASAEAADRRPVPADAVAFVDGQTGQQGLKARRVDAYGRLDGIVDYWDEKGRYLGFAELGDTRGDPVSAMAIESAAFGPFVGRIGGWIFSGLKSWLAPAFSAAKGYAGEAATAALESLKGSAKAGLGWAKSKWPFGKAPPKPGTTSATVEPPDGAVRHRAINDPFGPAKPRVQPLPSGTTPLLERYPRLPGTQVEKLGAGSEGLAYKVETSAGPVTYKVNHGGGLADEYRRLAAIQKYAAKNPPPEGFRVAEPMPDGYGHVDLAALDAEGAGIREAMALRYVAGQTLGRYAGKFSKGDLATVGAGLQWLKRAGYYHVDLGYYNVLVRQGADGRRLFTVIDFGRAAEATAGSKIPEIAKGNMRVLMDFLKRRAAP